MELTITLTDYEARLLSTEYVDIDFLFRSQLEGRILTLQNEIITKVARHCTASNASIPSTTGAILEYAFTNGLVSVASERSTATASSEEVSQ